MLQTFGGLAATLCMDPHSLNAATGNERVTHQIGLVRAAMLHTLREPLECGPVLSNTDAVLDYLKARIGRGHNESLSALYLNSRHHLIHELLVEGTIDEAPLYVRNIVKRGLEVGAAGILLAHNHPSGDVAPSGSDRTITAQVAESARLMSMQLYDHLIISGPDHFSFRSAGLL